MSQAVELSQQENWPAAAAEWKRAADAASLLNDQKAEAIALHNLAQAQRQLGDFASASSNALSAAALNDKLGRTNEWWRNQLLLVQLEASMTNRSPETRLKELESRLSAINDASTRGAFWNEAGLWQQKNGNTTAAGQSFQRAEAEYTSAKNPEGIATVLANRAGLLESERQFDAALRAWDEALRRFEDLAEPYGIAHALAGKGRSLLGLKQNVAEAEALLRRAARNFRNLKRESEARQATEHLINLLVSENRPAEAEALRR